MPASLKTNVKRNALLISLALGLTLVGCSNNNNNDDDGDGNGNLPTSGTVGEVATQQIQTATCEERTPQDLTNVTFTDSEMAIDVATVTPGCT